MLGEPVDASFAFCRDESVVPGRSEPARDSCRGDEGVPECIVMKQTMNICTECAAMCSNGAIANAAGFAPALNLASEFAMKILVERAVNARARQLARSRR